jgi:predicted nucleotidyltransferase
MKSVDENFLMSELKQKLHEIAPMIFGETPVLFAYLYGSYAKGLAHRFSDLDVGIYVEDLDTRACLNLELSLALHIDEQLDHAVQSEVRILNHLPLVVKGRILADGELIYSRDDMKRIDFETQVRKAYFDFLPVIQEHQNAYIKRLLSAHYKLTDGGYQA